MKSEAFETAVNPALRRRMRTRGNPLSPGNNLAFSPITSVSKTSEGHAPVSRRVIEISSAELEDGTQIELIEDPQDSSRSLLARFANGDIDFAEQFEFGNRIFVPISRTSNLLRHVQLPRGAKPYGTVYSLVANTRTLLSRVLDLSSNDLEFLALFILSTWFVERFSVAPYVALVGLPGSGKSTALSVLRLLCRRGLLTADISSAAFYAICDQLTPTLLIDEASTAGDRRTLFHLLRTGTTRDITALRKNESFKTFGPKAVAWIDLPSDAALNSRCIVIPLRETRRNGLLRTIDPEIRKAAADLQMSLLRYRFEKLRSLALPKTEDSDELRPRSRDLYEALALPIADIPEKRQWLVERLRAQEEIRRAPLSVKQSAVLEVVFVIMHGPWEQTVGDLTSLANNLLEIAGENYRLSAREVGGLLTSLGFTERGRTNRGWLISTSQRQIIHAHNLVSIYGMSLLPMELLTDIQRPCKRCKPLSRSTLRGLGETTLATWSSRSLRRRRRS